MMNDAALLIIDLQYEYFSDGAYFLVQTSRHDRMIVTTALIQEIR